MTNEPPAKFRMSRPVLAGGFVALTAGLVLGQSTLTLLVWSLDGVAAAAMLCVAIFAGAALLPLFRLGPLERFWQWLLAAGLGVGVVSTVTLICGVCGQIGPQHRLTVPLILAGLAVLGARFLLRQQTAAATADSGRLVWIVLTLAPFAALTMLVATIPPGVLWQEEGMGYDVLEYHLQLPKEYYENGAITYLPHNVYANFPAAAEMLYLFGINTVGAPIEGWTVAKCLNALLGVFAVGAAWLAGRTSSPRGGVIAAVLMGSAGWLVYLSGIAYVENGMLFLGMLATACLLRGVREPEPPIMRRWIVLGGVLVGLACGFKYTGVVLIALPLGLGLLVWQRGNWRRRLMCGLAFACAALLTFSPWLIKNVALTGNPVFPLLGSTFTDYPAGWGPEEAQHFAEAHAPGIEERSAAARLGALWRHIPGDHDQRFGVALFVLAFIGILRRPQRREWGFGVLLLVQLGVWLLSTHLYARFAVPMLIPLVLLAARATVDDEGQPRPAFLALVVLGAALNLTAVSRLYVSHLFVGGSRLDIEGSSDPFTQGWVSSYRHVGYVNKELPAGSRVLLVGEARPFYLQRPCSYCVVFNANPFAEIADASPRIEDVLAWLQENGYSHILVHWMEIERLRHSRYGFPEAITPLLFEELADAGVRLVEVFEYGEPPHPYAALYEVPEKP